MSSVSRKKFLFSGLSLAAIAAYFANWGSVKPNKKKTMKFLTQDGKLVEIDIDKLPISKKAATREDVQTWIKR
jgi:hypothetical protein